MDKVTIELDTLKWLIGDSLELAALECAGVDNWEGYDEVEPVTEEQVDSSLQRLLEE